MDATEVMLTLLIAAMRFLLWLAAGAVVLLVVMFLLRSPAVAFDYTRIPANIESKNVVEIPWALPHLHGLKLPRHGVTRNDPGIGIKPDWDRRFGKLPPWPEVAGDPDPWPDGETHFDE